MEQPVSEADSMWTDRTSYALTILTCARCLVRALAVIAEQFGNDKVRARREAVRREEYRGATTLVRAGLGVL
jgi:hypothetical protein